MELAVRPKRDVACRRRPRKKHSRWRDPRADEGRCVRKTDMWLWVVRAEGVWRGVAGSQLEERGPEHQGVRGWVRLSRLG